MRKIFLFSVKDLILAYFNCILIFRNFLIQQQKLLQKINEILQLNFIDASNSSF